MTASPNKPPKAVAIIINLTGLGVVVHETVATATPRWWLLVISVVMMGLASPDLFDRFVGKDGGSE